MLAITSIARSAGCVVVGEKIERQDTVTMLSDMGVAYGQGFLLHRPEPLDAIIARATAMAPVRKIPDSRGAAGRRA